VDEIEVTITPSWKHQIAMLLTAQLYHKTGEHKKYAEERLGVLRDNLELDGLHLLDGRHALLEVLAQDVKPELLYPLTPSMIKGLSSIFDDVRMASYKSLVLITNQKFLFKDDPKETIEQYQEWYDTKMKVSPVSP
jgi:hypothetical protein